MRNYKQEIASDIIQLMIDKALSPSEEAVLSVLTKNWSLGAVSQKDIVHSDEWKKAHPLYVNADTNTSTRKLRKVINNLRIKHKLPILHNQFGHFLPDEKDHVEEFIRKLEADTKAQVCSKLETYQQIKDIFQIETVANNNVESISGQLMRLYDTGI
jgi:hypothetical protein